MEERLAAFPSIQRHIIGKGEYFAGTGPLTLIQCLHWQGNRINGWFWRHFAGGKQDIS
jgi:hypothetical protein